MAALVAAALGGGPARARLFEVAAVGRTSGDGSLDVLLDDLAGRAAAGDEAATERRQWWLVRVGSLPILLLGLFWLIDRVFQLNLMPF